MELNSMDEEFVWSRSLKWEDVVLEVALDLEAGADLGLDQGADQDLEEVTKADPNLEAGADLIHQRIVLVQGEQIFNTKFCKFTFV